MMLFALGVATFETPMFKLLFDLFPSRIHCTGIALTRALGQSLFFSPSPMLSDYYGWLGGVLCMFLVCFVALVAIHLSAHSHEKPEASADST